MIQRLVGKESYYARAATPSRSRDAAHRAGLYIERASEHTPLKPNTETMVVVHPWSRSLADTGKLMQKSQSHESFSVFVKRGREPERSNGSGWLEANR
jgi:hypothetical protein